MKWEEVALSCPLCGYELCHHIVKGKKGTFNIRFFCDDCEDNFVFDIATGLTDSDFEEFEKGKPVKREMTLTLLELKREEEPS